MFYRVSKCVAMTITLILSSLPIVCVCVCAVGIFCDRVLLFFPLLSYPFQQLLFLLLINFHLFVYFVLIIYYPPFFVGQQ